MVTDDEIGAILAQLHHQQVMIYALHEYLLEQKDFDAKRFGEIFAEFDADLVAALKKRPTTRVDVALLQRLSKLKGPKH